MSAPTAPPNALPIGLRLGELEIRAVIGAGGFGIVYRAFDHALEREVAIKEYMPSAMAARSATLHVSVLSQGHAETFALGLKSFVNEARLLARFDEPSLVKVHRFWEGNGTAYMVMPLYRGRTLKVLRGSLSESPSEAWLRGIVLPLLGALEVLHAEGVYHRDIAPDNILVGDDGRPVLLDFGAARRVIGDQSQALTAILKPSYAPIEQYAEATGLRQGPWTDLYALGATLHYAITGRAPQPATARALGTDRDALAGSAAHGLSVEFLRIVDWMMAPRPEHRPQSVAELREALAGRAAVPVPAPTALPESASPWERTVVVPAKPVRPAQRPARTSDILDAVADREAVRAPAPRAKTPAALAAALLGVAALAWWLAPWDREAAPIAIAAAAPAASAPLPAASAPTPGVAVADAASAAAASGGASAPTVAAAPASAPDLTAGMAVVAAPTDAASAATTHPANASPAPVGAPPATAKARKPARPVAPEEPAPDLVAVAIAREARAAPTEVLPEAPAAGASPREQCEGRVLIALHRCLKRACDAPAWAHTRECRRVRQIEAAAQRAEN